MRKMTVKEWLAKDFHDKRDWIVLEIICSYCDESCSDRLRCGDKTEWELVELILNEVRRRIFSKRQLFLRALQDQISLKLDLKCCNIAESNIVLHLDLDVVAIAYGKMEELIK